MGEDADPAPTTSAPAVGNHENGGGGGEDVEYEVETVRCRTCGRNFSSL